MPARQDRRTCGLGTSVSPIQHPAGTRATCDGAGDGLGLVVTRRRRDGRCLGAQVTTSTARFAGREPCVRAPRCRLAVADFHATITPRTHPPPVTLRRYLRCYAMVCDRDWSDANESAARCQFFARSIRGARPKKPEAAQKSTLAINQEVLRGLGRVSSAATTFPDRPVQRLIRCIPAAFFGPGTAFRRPALLGALGLFPKAFRSHRLALACLESSFSFCIAAVYPLATSVVGTILNALEIGLVVNLIGDHLPATDRLIPRLFYVVGAVVAIALGPGLYIGAGLGTGPRDGIMVALAARGYSVRVTRTVLEAVVMASGIALGGHIGIGTVAFMFGIGPLVHV